MKEFHAQVSMLRVHTSDGNYINISVEDEDTGNRILNVNVTMSEFAEMITGKGCVDAKGFFYGGENIGKVIENKSCVIAVPRSLHDQYYSLCRDSDVPKPVLDFLSRFETDGWKASPRDLFNMHRRVHGKGGEEDRENYRCNVGFRRYVDKVVTDEGVST